mgnify:CR=1 FL=1
MAKIFTLNYQYIMKYPAHVFKAYDIRGLSDLEITPEMARDLGRSFVLFLREKMGYVFTSGQKLVVGRDMRKTSPALAEALIEGILESGVGVADIGLCTTPLFNFTCAHYADFMGGIMVTASHNPGDFNGFKLTMKDGLPVGETTGLPEIYFLMERGSHIPSDQRGELTTFNPREDYYARIFALVDPKEIKPLKVVFDAGNGMAMATFEEFLQKLPVQVEKMYFNPDGNFPNHEANPLKIETLRDLQRKVRETGADFGFATDGDADRIGLVDETGEIVPASFAGEMVGLEILKQKRSGLMLYDPRISHAVRENWEKNGATTDMCKVGHANIKKMMKERKAIFAAELSLHLYYGDMYDLESSDLSFLYFAHMLSTSGKKLSELWKPLQSHFHSGEINFQVEDREAVMGKLREKFSDAKISTLDGLLFEYPDCWISIRMSNTEPLVRLVAEADTAELLAEKIAEVEGEIKGV